MEDRAVRLVISTSFVLAILVLTITLRFISRRVIVGILLVDDWLMLVGVILGSAFVAVNFAMVQHGFGKHVENIPLEDLVFIAKALLAQEILYHMAIAFMKCSMLVFILRIIPAKTRSRTIGVATIWMLMGYQVINFVVLMLQCVPLGRLWNPQLPGTCIHITIFFFFGSAFNIVTDFIIFLLPIKWLAAIKRSNSDKILLLGLFGISLFGCIVGIIRLYSIQAYGSQANDFTWAIYPLDIWSEIECAVAVLCGSTPALKPLVFRKRPTTLDTATPYPYQYQSNANVENSKSAMPGALPVAS